MKKIIDSKKEDGNTGVVPIGICPSWTPRYLRENPNCNPEDCKKLKGKEK